MSVPHEHLFPCDFPRRPALAVGRDGAVFRRAASAPARAEAPAATDAVQPVRHRRRRAGRNGGTDGPHGGCRLRDALATVNGGGTAGFQCAVVEEPPDQLGETDLRAWETTALGLEAEDIAKLLTNCPPDHTFAPGLFA